MTTDTAAIQHTSDKTYITLLNGTIANYIHGWFELFVHAMQNAYIELYMSSQHACMIHVHQCRDAL